jgi:hypothetical protein
MAVAALAVTGLLIAVALAAPYLARPYTSSASVVPRSVAVCMSGIAYAQEKPPTPDRMTRTDRTSVV